MKYRWFNRFPSLRSILPFGETHSRDDTNLSGFDAVYFPDAYVLAVRTGSVIEFDLDVYSRGRATLTFPNVSSFRWIEKHMNPIPGFDDPMDYGSISSLTFKDGVYLILGEWGELEIRSEEPTIRFVEPK